MYLASSARPSREQLLWASVLHGGPEAQVAGRNALVLHGWKQALCAPFDIAVASFRSRRLNPPWLRVHHGTDPHSPVRTPARVGVHLAAAQAAGWARTDREAMFIVVSALQQRLIAGPRMIAILSPNIRRRGLIIGITRESTPWSGQSQRLDFGALCRRFGVPAPVRQVRVVDAQGVCRRIDAESETHTGAILRVEIEGTTSTRTSTLLTWNVTTIWSSPENSPDCGSAPTPCTTSPTGS